ncbi:MAG: hypothetical protein AAF439_07900 [Pseudomonadota bacterium]
MKIAKYIVAGSLALAPMSAIADNNAKYAVPTPAGATNVAIPAGGTLGGGGDSRIYTIPGFGKLTAVELGRFVTLSTLLAGGAAAAWVAIVQSRKNSTNTN